MRVPLQPAFILHRRPYRETSALLDIFSYEYGRVALIARGARNNRAGLRSILQPFIPLLISWQGKSELMTLTSAEARGDILQLAGDALLSGFYLNELLVKVLQKQDPNPRLYTIYEHTLLELQNANQLQKTLRIFEKKLLEELGYGLQLQNDFATGDPFLSEKFYQYYPDHGFKQGDQERGFKGKSLLALAKEELNDEECLRDAKRLMRLVLSALLGFEEIHSRKLFNVKS